MSTGQKDEPLFKTLRDLKMLIPTVSQLTDESYEEFISLWHECVEHLKDAVYVPHPLNYQARLQYELGWSALSVMYAIDCIPEFHKVLLKYYKRKDELKLLDVGIGSGAGTNIFTLLHSDHFVYSKLSVYGIDHISIRKRFIKLQYPRINFSVRDLYDINNEKWDFVFCICVLEHVPNPRKFCEQLFRLCKGFTFIYVPYNEINRIPGHINTFTEEFFKDYKIESLKIIKSMGWHPCIPDDKMMLVVVDCRVENEK